MELIAAILIAGPLGYFIADRRRSLGAYIALWVVLFPIQTIVVHSAGASDVENPLYFLFNALILAGGIGLNIFGARRRERRQSAPVAA